MLRMIRVSALSIPRIKTEKGKVRRVSQQGTESGSVQV